MLIVFFSYDVRNSDINFTSGTGIVDYVQQPDGIYLTTPASFKFNSAGDDTGGYLSNSEVNMQAVEQSDKYQMCRPPTLGENRIAASDDINDDNFADDVGNIKDEEFPDMTVV